MSIKELKLSDGNVIPGVGLGLWKIRDEAVFNKMFESAAEAGFRHFDCAQAYGNEQFLGNNWRRSGLARKDLFITTKILVQHLGYKKTIATFAESLTKLQTDYVDLLLVHFPGPKWQRKAKWRAMEDIKRSGRAKSIGVSNHSVGQLKSMEAYAKEMPVINQIELHVFLQQQVTRDYCAMHNIQIEAYSPLAHGRAMNDPIVQQIAYEHGKSYSQIMLRWCVEQGAIPLPKSVTPARIKEDLDIFDFKLSHAELQKLNSLDRNFRTVWHSILFG